MANNLKVFDTIQEYENAVIENNSVSYVKEDNSIRYSGGVEHSVHAPVAAVKINGTPISADTDGNIDIGSVQEQLVSGDNIKTINNQSILGRGNIEIVGGNTDIDLSAYATKLDLNNKVDKVSGKQLSTEDFTTALKDKLSGLKNYDDTSINSAISSLQTQLNTLVSGDASTAIESFNEIIAFLDGVQDTQDLSSIISSIEQQIASKQDKINDLETIRSGAAKGATALQSYTEKYTGTITGIKMNGASKGTSGVVDLGTVITSHQDISGKADKSSLAAVATSGSYNDLTNKPTIPAEQVNADWNATSGKAQILNKPTIPSAVTESTVSGWGFTKNAGTVTGVKINGSSKGTSGVVDLGNVVTSVKINGSSKAPSSGVVDLGTVGTYSKPSTGIPKTDLASAVQTSLGKADTALQSYTEQYQGTVSAIATSETIDDVNEVPNVKYVAQTLTNAQKTQARTNIGAGDVMSSSLSAVATSGSYNDLSNKPTIPAEVTTATVSGWGFTKNTGTYSKPSGGIPKTDLASAVQTSLGKADTALQSYTEQYKGTITGVSANGTSVATSGVANIPAASTSKYGVTKLSSATNSTSTSLAATASAVKAAYDLANGKQAALVSGTNIKTINGQSLLGSGNITIEGGSSGGSSDSEQGIVKPTDEPELIISPGFYNIVNVEST